MSKMKLRPVGKRPRGRSGGAGRGITNDTPHCPGQSFRNSVSPDQTPPTEECQINQHKRQAGIA